MKPFRFTTGLAALGVFLTSAGPIEAAWNNVFQVTCHRRNRVSSGFIAAPAYSVPITSGYQNPCCNPCPPVCTTQYVQRCYYQPETTYRTETRYEAVTSYTTRYFYEPVVSYRYSCHYDPCTCSYRQVATPVTSYQVRAQCCPVQTWVARCVTVPVTVQRQCCYWVPQTTCQPGAGQVQVPVPQVPPPPGIGEQRQTPPPPMIDEKKGNGNPGFNQFYGPSNNPNQLRQLPPGNPAGQPAAPKPIPGVKLDRIVLDLPEQRFDGQVVALNNAPQANAQVMFVSAKREAANQTVTANTQGRFQVSLPQGGWLVYVTGPDGQQTFHSRIEVDDRQPPVLTLTSR